MKCISFGYLVVLIIMLSIGASFVGGQSVVGIVNFGLFSWWVAGFFTKCDGYIGYSSV